MNLAILADKINSLKSHYLCENDYVNSLIISSQIELLETIMIAVQTPSSAAPLLDVEENDENI